MPLRNPESTRFTRADAEEFLDRLTSSEPDPFLTRQIEHYDGHWFIPGVVEGESCWKFKLPGDRDYNRLVLPQESLHTLLNFISAQSAHRNQECQSRLESCSTNMSSRNRQRVALTEDDVKGYMAQLPGNEQRYLQRQTEYLLLPCPFVLVEADGMSFWQERVPVSNESSRLIHPDEPLHHLLTELGQKQQQAEQSDAHPQPNFQPHQHSV